jgi:periplasmic protein TonB
MKSILFLFFSLLIFTEYFSQTDSLPLKESKILDSIAPVENKQFTYQTVDQSAEFPGGMSQLRKFIIENFSYPPDEMERGIQGKCIVKFIVRMDGKIVEASILKGVPDGPNCDKEALRLVRKMPDWQPAVLNGKKVQSYFQLPIQFVISED